MKKKTLQISLQKLFKSLFYLFIFLLPWQTIFLLRETFIDGEKFQYTTIGIYTFQVILFLWIILFLIKSKKSLPKKSILNTFILLFLFWSLLSITWSGDKYLSLFFTLQLALSVFLFLLIQSSKLSTKKIIKLFLVSTFFQGCLGLIQFFTQSSFSNKWLGISDHLTQLGGTSVLENEIGRWLRAYGGMPHPNILGGFLAISIILGIFLYLNSQNKKENFWKFLTLSILPINFLALLTTFSRSAWLGLLLGLALIFGYLIYTKQKILLKKMSFLFIIFTIIFSVFFINYSNLITPRFSTETRLEKKSINERTILLKESQKIINNNVLLGIGAGNYTNHLYKTSSEKKPIWKYQPVHNTFLLIFSELGLIGFFLFIGIILFSFQNIKENFKENKTTKMFWLSTLVILFVIMFFDHWLWTSSSGVLLFWLLLGLSRR